VDLDPLLLLDLSPALLELLLHLAPHSHRLLVQVLDLVLRRLLQLVESELSLDNGRFLHEELELRVR
jgi:hypothetical protein